MSGVFAAGVYELFGSIWLAGCRGPASIYNRASGEESTEKSKGKSRGIKRKDNKGVAHNRPRVKARVRVVSQRDRHAGSMIVVLGEAESGSAGDATR